MTKLARTYISAVTNDIRNKESTKPSLPLLYDITVYFSLRIDYCDERVFQENSYISGAISLTHTYYISYEGQCFSVLDHTSNM